MKARRLFFPIMALVVFSFLLVVIFRETLFPCAVESVSLSKDNRRFLADRTERLMEGTRAPSGVHGVRNRLRRVVLGVVLGALIGVVAALIVAGLIRVSALYMTRTPILKGPVNFCSKINPKMLAFLCEEAAFSDSQLIGLSPNGKYYKAVLENGFTVAIKRIESASPPAEAQSKSAKRRIQKNLEVLGCLRHRHLMTLHAYINLSDRYSLVYDYMPNGSLEDAMKKVRASQLRLNWEMRHRIAVGVIKGLQFLHFGCSPRVLHYDLKPANVLLDDDFEPRLADYGLLGLMQETGRTSAYVAPECFQSCRYTEKSDVFSFGVILAVLLTGRDPVDPFFGEEGGGSMGRWLRHLQQAGEAREGLDKDIVGDEGEEEEMLMAVRIAVVCLSDMPADRPSSDELVPMLTQLHSF
ncbi:Inactive leucine-rich repeat receptor-like protein kinase [Nymphaea thermarum]|nr:Inactive leucine-rich repeat receptor-like protein kinase [Nymphaea thermarum]